MVLDLLRLIPDAIVMHSAHVKCTVWRFAKYPADNAMHVYRPAEGQDESQPAHRKLASAAKSGLEAAPLLSPFAAPSDFRHCLGRVLRYWARVVSVDDPPTIVHGAQSHHIKSQHPSPAGDAFEYRALYMVTGRLR